MNAMPALEPEPRVSKAASEWAEITESAPVMAETMLRYLAQLSTFLSPASVKAADNVLRQLALWLLANTDVVSVAGVRRLVRRVGRHCGVQVHPHQLRHTLATQAINRGMRLEAIAALLKHRSLEMTLVYARIANRVVADEYRAVSEKIDALYGQELHLSADYETTGMAKLRREAHARMLGNGLCVRPVELDCRMESACETCSYFRTTVEFKPTLTRQRDHARTRGQAERASLFDNLLQRLEEETP